VLGWTGVRIYQEAPPIPERVLAENGSEVLPPGAIQAAVFILDELPPEDRARCARG